jgi:small-conductance mechanosensitive channel
LFAFVLVCGGVLFMQLNPRTDYTPAFRVFRINARWWMPLLYVAAWGLLAVYNTPGLAEYWSFTDAEHSVGWSIVSRLPLLVFIVAATGLTVLALRRSYSLIPALGMLTCLYLMAEVDVMSWIRFGAWLAVGLAIYFLWSRHNSQLAREGGGENMSTHDSQGVGPQ